MVFALLQNGVAVTSWKYCTPFLSNLFLLLGFQFPDATLLPQTPNVVTHPYLHATMAACLESWKNRVRNSLP